MSFYINLLIFALVCVILSFFFKRKRRVIDFIYIIGATVITLVVALRDESLGTDTTTYCELFLHPDAYETDIGFLVYNSIIRLFTDSKDWYIFITAILTFWPLFYVIGKDSHNKVLSLFVFITMGTTILFYALFFAAMRQCLAVSLLLSLVYNVRQERITSLPIILFFNVLIGLIHLTAFLFIPVFLIRKVNFNKIVVVIVLIFSFVTGFSLQSYMQYVNLLDLLTEGRFGYYLNYVTESSYEIMTTLPLLMIAILITCCSSEKLRNDIYYKMFIIGVVVNNTIVLASNSSRLTMMFLIAACIVIPNFIFEISKNNLIKIIKYVFVLVLLSYYSTKYIHTWDNIDKFDNANLVPYKTNSIIKPSSN